MQRRTLMNLMALGVLLAKAPFAAAEGDDMVRIAKPFNVAMLTGGDYDRYRQILLAFAQGLGRLEMIESAPAGLSLERKDTADVWEALAENAGGHYLRFLPDAHYSYDFTPEKRPEVLRSMVSRIRERKDVDLILVFGTEPTLDIAEAVKDIPIMSLSTTDPVNSGVVADEEDSGQDNLHVLVTKDFFFRQVENLYAIHPFKDIGFIVAEQRAGRTGLGDVRAACVKLGMTLHDATYIEKEVPEDSERFPEFKEALVKLLDEGVEAVLFPWFPCSDEQFAEVLALLVKRGVWGYSLDGPRFVSRGIMLGAGQENFESYGLFEADVLRRIIVDNELPRSISQVFVQQNRLSINLRTALQIGWQVPFEVLVSAEEVYTTQS